MQVKGRAKKEGGRWPMEALSVDGVIKSRPDVFGCRWFVSAKEQFLSSTSTTLFLKLCLSPCWA